MYVLPTHSHQDSASISMPRGMEGRHRVEIEGPLIEWLISTYTKDDQ